MYLRQRHFTAMIIVSLCVHGGAALVYGSLRLTTDREVSTAHRVQVLRIDRISERIEQPKIKAAPPPPRRVQSIKSQKRERPIARQKVPVKVKQEAVAASLEPNASMVSNPVVAEVPSASPEVRASYETLLASWLEREKRYPRRALRRRVVGQLSIAVTIDSAGNVLGTNLSKSSGHAILDAEALAMVRRAEPFPAIPEELKLLQFSFVAPIDFELG